MQFFCQNDDSEDRNSQSYIGSRESAPRVGAPKQILGTRCLNLALYSLFLSLLFSLLSFCLSLCFSFRRPTLHPAHWSKTTRNQVDAPSLLLIFKGTMLQLRSPALERVWLQMSNAFVSFSVDRTSDKGANVVVAFRADSVVWANAEDSERQNAQHRIRSLSMAFLHKEGRFSALRPRGHPSSGSYGWEGGLSRTKTTMTTTTTTTTTAATVWLIRGFDSLWWHISLTTGNGFLRHRTQWSVPRDAWPCHLFSDFL